MERIRKTYFDPLVTTKEEVRQLLQDLPLGSAHPFRPDGLLLVKTDTGINEIDISSYPEDYFFNAVDLGEMGEVLLSRMACFPELNVFKDFQIAQAPASTFSIPIVSDMITILAVSELTPTYWDFCFADAECNTCCWLERTTFPGITHSGDIVNGKTLLDFVRIDEKTLTDQDICVFSSGYRTTMIKQFLGTHPAMLVADHVDKVLYTIPVPLDAATVGDATIVCPLVIRRDRDFLVCSILPTATKDRNMFCSGRTLKSPSFAEAIGRANFEMTASTKTSEVAVPKRIESSAETALGSECTSAMLSRDTAVISTYSTRVPEALGLKEPQMIYFGTGLEFQVPGRELTRENDSDQVVLPCIFGSQLSGSILLATGTTATNSPVLDQEALREYYKQLKHVVVLVNDRMTDMARSLATPWRINALFIVQLSPEKEPQTTDDVLELMNSANINAVTALAGPMSLVLVQILDKLYFYRGVANLAHLNTSKLAFGSDVTSAVESLGIESLLDPRMDRVVNLNDENRIMLPVSGQKFRPSELAKMLEDLSPSQMNELEDEIAAAVPQLQLLLDQKELQQLSSTLVSALSAKISKQVSPLREAYIAFLKNEHQRDDVESVKKKNQMLGELRKATKEMQKALEPAITSLSNIMSAQTSSKRTHDLKRLARQSAIQNNVEATKSMTFDTLAGYLEEHAADMGVMLLNVDDNMYPRMLRDIEEKDMDTTASTVCDLDSRVLHLDGFDAGIIIEQSQSTHWGPLRGLAGPTQPTLGLPVLSEGYGSHSSTLAWVCWDEFVNLQSPFTVRWMEKCNEPHIAALRIIMRDTLSQTVASREFNLEAGSPSTGHLMSALLMAAMSKLASRRSSAPAQEIQDAEDAVTRLMRGLFGNLLTIAGSGVRPLSMVWQLFGFNTQNDLPPANSPSDWIWYETVVKLYPYTTWPRKKFYINLEKLLDKAILRVVTKAEDIKTGGGSMNSMIEFCRLRNIQLQHSRTIVTIFQHMFSLAPSTTTTTTSSSSSDEIRAIATRLLKHIPQKLDRQTEGYRRIVAYLNHLTIPDAPRMPDQDFVLASTYTKRSACFAPIKKRVAAAIRDSDLTSARNACRELLRQRDEVAAQWGVEPKEELVVQNMKAYEVLLETEGKEGEDGCEGKVDEATRRILDDAEMNRVPWFVSRGRRRTGGGDGVEPLDEGLLGEILTGGERGEEEVVKAVTGGEKEGGEVGVGEGKKHDDEEEEEEEKKKTEEEIVVSGDVFTQFEGTVKEGFLKVMRQDHISPEAVCQMMGVTASAMRAFVEALSPTPESAWDELGQRFQAVVFGLLRERSRRDETRPVRKLLGMDEEVRQRLIEG